MNYCTCIDSPQLLYRYRDDEDWGDFFNHPNEKWEKSLLPPSLVDCLKFTPYKWKPLSEYEAIEQFPEAFQDETESLHTKQQR